MENREKESAMQNKEKESTIKNKEKESFIQNSVSVGRPRGRKNEVAILYTRYNCRWCRKKYNCRRRRDSHEIECGIKVKLTLTEDTGSSFMNSCDPCKFEDEEKKLFDNHMDTLP